MSEPITIKERRAVEWREQEVSYTYEELLELFGDDDCSAVRPLVLRCMALEQERATFYEDYQRKFDVETKALHAEIERLRNKLNTDSQHFELECRKAQIELLERERGELRALLSDADERAHLAHGVAELAMKHRDAAERERDEARAEASEAYQLFPPLLQDIDHALNGPDPDEITRRSYVPLPARAREVMAALVESRALLRECRDWFNEGPDADRPDDLCGRLDAALGGRDE